MQARQRCGGVFSGLWVRRGRGCSVWVQGETQEPAFGKPGRSQAPPLRWNCERAIKISRILLRFIVGVGLCSTRGALRQHKALAGEQCSPLLYNRKGGGCFCVGLPFACRGLHGRPANGAGVYFRGCGCGEGGVFGVGCGEKRRGQRSERRAEPSPAPTIELRNSAKI